MRIDASDVTPRISHFFHTNKNVRISLPPGVDESKNVFEKLALPFWISAFKRVLAKLEIKRLRFVLMEKRFK